MDETRIIAAILAAGMLPAIAPLSAHQQKFTEDAKDELYQPAVESCR